MNFKKAAAIATAVGALTALAIPALAETTIYGSARFATFYDINKTTATGTTSGFDEHLQVNSRLGVNAKDGAVGGKFEIGLRDGGAAAPNANNVYTRLLYGTYDFGGGVLTVGQDYNSYYTFTAQSFADDNGLNGYGSMWDGRQAQIKVKLNNGLYLAAIQPTGDVEINGSTGGSLTNYEKTNGGKSRQLLPKVNLGYAGKAGAFGFNVGVVGQTLTNATDKQVNSILGYVQGNAAFGPSSIMFNLSYAQNPGNMGFNGRASGKMVGTNLKNAAGFEGYLQATQKISDSLSANAGVGYVNDKVKGDKHFDDKITLFVNAPITLAKNVSITPKFDYIDQLKNSAGAKEKTKDCAIGAKWMINF